MIKNFSTLIFEIISYDYSQLCSCLEHVVIDFLVVKYKIPFSVMVLSIFYYSFGLHGGESTLEGGSKMLSHYTIFQGCPCLNFNHCNIGT
jgi:hypothetical protein